MNIERAEGYALDAIRYAEMSKDQAEIAQSNFLLAYVYFHNRQLNKALISFEKVFSLYRRIQDYKGATYVRYYSGYAHNDRGEFEAAVKDFEDALELARYSRDSALVNIALNALGPAYCEIHEYQKGLEAANEALNIATNLQFNLNSTYHQMALVQQSMGEFERSIEFLNLSREYLASRIDTSQYSPEYKNLAAYHETFGTVHMLTGQYDSSLTHLHSLLETARTNNDPFLEAKGYQMMAKFQFELGDYVSAKDKIHHALLLNEETLDSIVSLEILIDILIAEDSLTQAKNIIINQSRLSEGLELQSQGITTNEQLGAIQFKEANYEASVARYLIALRIAKNLGNKKMLPSIYKNLAHSLYATNAFDNAISYADSSLALSLRYHYRHNLDAVYNILAKCHEAKGQYQNALVFAQRYQQVKDSLMSLETSKELLKLETQFKVKEKEKENIILRASNEAHIATVRQRTTLTGALIIILILVTIIAFILKRNVKLKQQKNHALQVEIETQTQELVNRNRELLEIKNAQELQQAKSVFFANVSHEFRTPLTIILGTLDSLITSGKIPIEVHPKLERAKRNGSELLKLITELLDITKLDSGKPELSHLKTNLYPELRKILANFETLASSKRIEVNLHFSADQGLCIYTDQIKLFKIVNNLIGNAIKFTPSYGKVNVAVDYLNDELSIRVDDNGIGIPKDHLELIFERYYQIGQETGKQAGRELVYQCGSGIGLSLCQQYVELLGGEIWAESPGSLGMGSSFEFRIPVRKCASDLLHDNPDENRGLGSPQETSLSALHSASRMKPRVLVVEDHEDLREFLTETLQEKYSILATANGVEALKWLNEQNELPDLIISDIMMPEMNGFELLKRLKDSDRFRSIPVIMLTARAELRDRLNALRIGVDDYILKPFEKHVLQIRIDNLLGNFEERREMVENKLQSNEHLSSPSLSHNEYQWLLNLELEAQKLITDFNYTAEDLAHALHMSRAKFFKEVKKLTGLTVNQYIKEIRLQTARRLLEEKSVTSVKELSYTVGFKHINYFSKSYEERFGQRPSELL